MSDWTRIETEENQYVRYVRQRPDCAFALCHLGWRQGGPLAPRPAALLEFYFRDLCELYAKWGNTQWWYGAALDWASRFRHYEVWMDGEVL